MRRSCCFGGRKPERGEGDSIGGRDANQRSPSDGKALDGICDDAVVISFDELRYFRKKCLIQKPDFPIVPFDRSHRQDLSSNCDNSLNER